MRSSQSIWIKLILLFLLATPSCLPHNNNRIVSYFNDRINSSIQLPVKDIELTKHKYKLTFWVNGECDACLTNIDKWHLLAEEIEFGDVQFIGFLYLKNSSVADSICKTNKKKNFVLIHDSLNAYIVNNDLISSNHLSSLLLDNKNRIIIMGDPTKSDEIKQLFREKISKNQSAN